jgi:hypothetical protein
MNELRVLREGPFVWIYSLDLVQKGLDILRLLQIRLEDGWRGCTPISLSDHENPRALEGVEDLASKQTAGSGDKNYRRHVRAIVKEKLSAGEDLLPVHGFAGLCHDVTDFSLGFAWPKFVYR